VKKDSVIALVVAVALLIGGAMIGFVGFGVSNAPPSRTVPSIPSGQLRFVSLETGSWTNHAILRDDVGGVTCYGAYGQGTALSCLRDASSATPSAGRAP
jgi:hypothetical protein